MTDTHPLIRQKMYELIRRLTPEQRLMKCFRFYQDGRKLAETGALLKNPRLTGKELKVEVFRRMYRNDLPEETIQTFIERYMQNDINQGD